MNRAKRSKACRICGDTLKHYDRVKRFVRLAYGKSTYITVDRVYCKRCGKIQRDLPDSLLPYCHYEKRVIEGFQNGSLTQEQLEYEDYPSDTTIRRWIRKRLE